MDFKEAVGLLRKGEKIRRVTWMQGSHLFFTEDGIKHFIRENIAFQYDLSVIDSNDWIIGDDEKNELIEFTDVIENLVEGKIARLKDWPLTTYIAIDRTCNQIYLSRYAEFDYIPSCLDFMSKDWMVLRD